MAKPDGFYLIDEVLDDIDKCFKTEKELCEFIEANIVNFCDELGFKYKSHTREYPLQHFKKRRKGTKRIDFLINTCCGQSLGIECKHPVYNCELAAGIGQILSYITQSESFGTRIDKFYMVSSKIDMIAPMTITRFNLPITFIAMDKTKSLTWQKK